MQHDLSFEHWCRFLCGSFAIGEDDLFIVPPPPYQKNRWEIDTHGFEKSSTLKATVNYAIHFQHYLNIKIWKLVPSLRTDFFVDMQVKFHPDGDNCRQTMVRK